MNLLTLGLIQILFTAQAGQASVVGRVVYAETATAVALQASVVGRVVDAETATAVAGAVVTLTELDRTVATDTSGRYVFPLVPAGPGQVTVRCVGYAPRSLLALVPADGTLEINVSLAPEPVLLQTVEVHSTVPVRGLERSDSSSFPDREISLAAMRDHALLAEPDAFAALGGGDIVLDPESPTGIHIRGGASDQTAYLLDGVPVFSPFHASGMSSTWNPDALSEVSVTSASPSLTEPHALSGAVEAATREPGDRMRAQGSFSNVQTRLTLDGPLATTGAGYLLSARSGLRDLFAPRGESSYLRGGTGDWLAKLEAPEWGGRLRVLACGSADRVGAAATPVDSSGRAPLRNFFDWSSRSLGAEWKRSGPKSAMRFLAWGAEGDARSAWTSAAGPIALEATHRNLGALAAWERRARAGTFAELRVEEIMTGYQVESDSANGPSFRLDGRTPLVTALVRQTVPLGPRLGLELGASIAPTGREFNFGPHARLRWKPSQQLTVSGGYVRSHQIVQSLRNAESFVGNIFPVDVAVSAGSGGVPIARGDLGTVAVEFRPRPGLHFSVEGYERGSDGLLLVAPRDGEPFSTGAFTIGAAESHGVSAEAGMSSTRWGIVADYGWQRVRYEHADSSYVPEHGAAHHLDCGVILFPTPTSSVRLGATAILGRRTTIVPGGLEWVSNNLLNQGSEFVGTPHYSGEALGTSTLPAYARLDLGVRKRWPIRLDGRLASLELFTTASNILGRKNVLTYARNPTTGRLIGIESRALSVLVAGLDWRF